MTSSSISSLTGQSGSDISIVSILTEKLSTLQGNREPFFVLILEKGDAANSIKASTINETTISSSTPSIEFTNDNNTVLENEIIQHISPGLKTLYNTIQIPLSSNHSEGHSEGGSRKHRRRHKQKKNKHTKRRTRK
jgi:hypothetical protein